MNLVYGLVHHESLVAKWLEHPTGVLKVTGANPVGDSDFFFVLVTKMNTMVTRYNVISSMNSSHSLFSDQRQ